MRTFGHKRPVRDEGGAVIETKPSPVGAVTIGTLDGSFGKDRGRRLIVTLDDGDLITIRPAGTRRKYRATAADALRWMIRSEANLKTLQKARAKKEAKAARMAEQRSNRAAKKLDREIWKGHDRQ